MEQALLLEKVDLEQDTGLEHLVQEHQLAQADPVLPVDTEDMVDRSEHPEDFAEDKHHLLLEHLELQHLPAAGPGQGEDRLG